MKSLVSKLEGLCIGDTEDAVLDYVAGLDETKINDSAKYLETVLRRAEKLEVKIANASGFMSPETFNAIAGWLADGDCACPTRGEMRGPDLWVREHGGSSVLLRPISHIFRFDQGDAQRSDG